MIGVGTFRTSKLARQLVNQVLDSERLSYGPFLQKFERVFASAHGCRYGIMTASGTCALMIALAALKNRHGWADGDEVIVPAVTFIATSNIVLQLNMTPVFVDVDPLYYELDPSKLEEAITQKTRCIIPVHLFGQPCDMDPILAIAAKHKLRIIEDTCETMFATYNGRPVGSFGDVGCFSTYVAHILVTGVGGLCTTNDAELAIQMRSLMNHGRDSIYISIDDDKNKTEEEKKVIIARRFSFVQMGYSFRVTELEGALGLAAFEDRDRIIKARRANASYFSGALKGLEDHIQLPAIRPNTEHSFMMYPIVMKNTKKTEFVNYLEANGIETRDMLPLINQPFYRNIFGDLEQSFPVSKWINESGFYIASHQDLSQAEREYIVRIFKAYFDKTAAHPEKNTLIIMSRLPERDFNEVRLLNMYEDLPVGEFQELILADGAGNNQLARFFERRGFRVIQSRTGKGAILEQAVASTNNENIVVVGIDGTDNLKDIDKILIRLKNGRSVVIASRFMLGGERSSKGFITGRSFGNKFFAFLVGLIFRQNVTDTNNLFRGFKRSSFIRLALGGTGDNVMFEMTVRALRNKLDIDEFPTIERPVGFKIQKRNRFLSGLQFFWILFRNSLF